MAKNTTKKLLDIWTNRVSLWNSKKKQQTNKQTKNRFESWFHNFQFQRMRVAGNDHERSTGKELKRVTTDKCLGSKRLMN